GQVLLSIGCKDSNSNHAQEALRRAKFSSSPAARRLLLGLYLTKFSHNDYVKWKSEGRIIPDGVNGKEITCLIVQLLGCHGLLANRQPGKALYHPLQ
ncbi:unnamed protein product, partial [Musa acuminata var. zebrina]